jgi:hypothetical protein
MGGGVVFALVFSKQDGRAFANNKSDIIKNKLTVYLMAGIGAPQFGHFLARLYTS